MSSKKVTGLSVALQSGTETTLFATWKISDSKNYVLNYSWEWRYCVDKTWFTGSSGTSPANTKSCTYSAPANAVKAQVRVKPNPKTYKKDNKDTARFTGTWSAWVTHTFKIVEDKVPIVPPVPTVKVNGYTLTAQVDVYDPKGNTENVEFEIVVNNTMIYLMGRSQLVTNRASYQCSIRAGHTYKVRARGVNGIIAGEWSEYSGDDEGVTLPSAIPGTPACRGTSSTSAELIWTAAPNAQTYTIEYTNERTYFDSAPQQVRSITIESGTRAEVTGLDSGEEWFFRIKGSNDQGESEWSVVVSTLLGKKPNPPTTWSSTTTLVVGGSVYLYWVHNSEDGSREASAQIDLVINGIQQPVITIPNNTPEDEDTATHQYLLNTSAILAGATVLWRVRTLGIMPSWGDWSVQRRIDIYAPPTLNMMLGSKNDWYWDPFNFVDGNIFTSEGVRHPLTDGILTQFPLFVELSSGPTTQTPVGYFISITAEESYEEIDDLGKRIYIVAGQEIFNQYYNVTDYIWVEWLTPDKISLENGMTYRITATVAMSSGLTAVATQTFMVDWADDEFDVDAELSFDMDSITAYIRPYCDDDDGKAVPGIMLSVYRREFDGRFTEVAANLSNILRPTVTDPHPTLNYARYRIVGKSRYTGQVLYYDMPGYRMEERAIVIQWNEEWSSYDVLNGDEMAERPWTGSLLKLPYNVDVSESNEKDVELIDYIGREHPVSYYGTQVGQTATWNAEIDKKDEETIYALRRLAAYMGDVYVREPSGTGYWASIKVSFSQEHVVLTVPVTLEITRVEGGL